MSATKRKHVTLTLKEKNEIIEFLNEGVSTKILSEKYGVGRATIYDIRNKKAKIQEFVSAVDSMDIGNRKTLRRPDNPAVEDALNAWILQKKLNNSPLSGPLLAEKARHFYNKITGKNDFTASSGWLDGFKSRHGIKFSSRNIKSEDCNGSDTKLHWRRLSNQSFENETNECEHKPNLKSNDGGIDEDIPTQHFLEDEASVSFEITITERKDDDPLFSAPRISSAEAVKCFETCIKWAEQNGCSSTEILLLRHMQEKARNS